ncbi:DsbA family protein [Pseudogemmobacter sonorensis]|uniref:DsbA family protein n=1 Tax=Pseudogemmobacter sonorensis TaxID=2989681 RepID=UPI0036847F04
MRPCLSLAAALLISGAALLPFAGARAGGLLDMTGEERAAFNDAVRAYLLENPEVLLEAMSVLQVREEALAAERDLLLVEEHRASIFESADDWSGGNPQGDLVVVEFMDYRCGYCHQAYDEVHELVASDGNIRFVLKELPVLGDASVMISKFAIAVRQLHGDAAYKAAHDALFSLRGAADLATLERLAAELGHEPGPIMARMQDPAVQAVIDRNYALAGALELSGTPTFVIGEALVRGYVALDGLRQIVAAERLDG